MEMDNNGKALYKVDPFHSKDLNEKKGQASQKKRKNFGCSPLGENKNKFNPKIEIEFHLVGIHLSP